MTNADGWAMTKVGKDGGASRVEARGWAGHRSFAGPCPEQSRMDQDDNAGNRMDAR